MENKQQQIIKQVLLNAIDNYFNGSTMDLLAQLFTAFKISQNTSFELFYRNNDDNLEMLLNQYDKQTILYNVHIKRDHQFLTYNGQTGYLMGIYNVDILELIKDELNDINSDFIQWAYEHLSINDIDELNKNANDKANVSFYGIDYV